MENSNKKYCQACGTPMDSGAMFCPECGEARNFAPTPPSRIKRPTGVLIIGILQILFSLVFLLVGLTLTSIGTDFSSSFFIPGSIIFAFGLLMLIPFIFAILFIAGINVARVLMMIGAVLDIISLAGIIWGIIVLWYLTRPRVRAYFKQPRHRPASGA